MFPPRILLLTSTDAFKEGRCALNLIRSGWFDKEKTEPAASGGRGSFSAGQSPSLSD
jgi:hypothetical protein